MHSAWASPGVPPGVLPGTGGQWPRGHRQWRRGLGLDTYIAMLTCYVEQVNRCAAYGV
jgi:hypothetical protein